MSGDLQLSRVGKVGRCISPVSASRRIGRKELFFRFLGILGRYILHLSGVKQTANLNRRPRSKLTFSLVKKRGVEGGSGHWFPPESSIPAVCSATTTTSFPVPFVTTSDNGTLNNEFDNRHSRKYLSSDRQATCNRGPTTRLGAKRVMGTRLDCPRAFVASFNPWHGPSHRQFYAHNSPWPARNFDPLMKCRLSRF